MKFLMNMNIPRELCRLLESKGHECRHAGDIGLAKADDPEIVKEAKISKEVIITHDLDYGNLLAFSGEMLPSVIIFRVKNTHSQNLYKRLMSAWKEIEDQLSKGAIVVLEDSSLRIRNLPIDMQPV